MRNRNAKTFDGLVGSAYARFYDQYNNLKTAFERAAAFSDVNIFSKIDPNSKVRIKHTRIFTKSKQMSMTAARKINLGMQPRFNGGETILELTIFGQKYITKSICSTHDRFVKREGIGNAVSAMIQRLLNEEVINLNHEIFNELKTCFVK